MQRARDRLGGNGQRTILFLDEIHRFNKAQQDALLPAVEERAAHADRRDDREPVLRGQLGAALALPGRTSSSRSPTTSSARSSGAAPRELGAEVPDELVELIAAPRRRRRADAR